jgi:hypothetical protein
MSRKAFSFLNNLATGGTLLLRSKNVISIMTYRSSVSHKSRPQTAETIQERDTTYATAPAGRTPEWSGGTSPPPAPLPKMASKMALVGKAARKRDF